MLNPNLFFNKELGYIDHIKSWYQLEFFLQEKAMPSPVFPYLIVDDCISEINSLFRIFLNIGNFFKIFFLGQKLAYLEHIKICFTLKEI